MVVDHTPPPWKLESGASVCGRRGGGGRVWEGAELMSLTSSHAPTEQKQKIIATRYSTVQKGDENRSQSDFFSSDYRSDSVPLCSRDSSISPDVINEKSCVSEVISRKFGVLKQLHHPKVLNICRHIGCLPQNPEHLCPPSPIVPFSKFANRTLES